MKIVLVVGVGALGSHLVQFLRSTSEASIRVLDFDKVDVQNVLSQFHSKTQVSRSKVVSLSQTMQFLFGTRIETIPHRLTKDNASELVGPAGLVVDCLDNAGSRRDLQRAVRSLSIPCLHGALAADGGFGRVVWDDAFAIDDEGSQGAPTCEGGEHLPFIAVVSGYLAMAARIFLTQGRRVGFQIHPTGTISI